MSDIYHSHSSPLLCSAALGSSSSYRRCTPQALRVHSPALSQRAGRCSVVALLICTAVLGCLVSTSAAVTVNPSRGSDFASCGVTPAPPCQTIAYAVRNRSASFIVLSAGVFNESAVNVTNVGSLVISGVPSATVFDCSSRPGPAFKIINSTVSISGVNFEDCSSPNANGGALSASGSSIVVSNCSFRNCSAASGGAMSVSGGLYVTIQNSNFTSNSAIGGLASCPADATQPCSTWGGAVAAFEVLNVNVTGCRMVNNSAQAAVPPTAAQHQFKPEYGVEGGSSVAGGGCLSVLFSGNASGSSLRVSDSTFRQCTVTLSINNGVFVGNGMPNVCIAVGTVLSCMFDACLGYGGGISAYFGLSAGLQLLQVATCSLALYRNDFTSCSVTRIAGKKDYSKGNLYGGGVSVYIGGYVSSMSVTDDAVAAIGDVSVWNASAFVETVSFTACSATNTAESGNTYGGSFSLYIGGCAWSYSSSSSSSTSGSTSASGVSVSISNVNSSDCSVTTTGVFGANSYGGAMSVNIGAYAWSYSIGSSPSSSSLSVCGTTSVAELVVSISSSSFSDSVAASRMWFCVVVACLTLACDTFSSRRMSGWWFIRLQCQCFCDQHPLIIFCFFARITF